MRETAIVPRDLFDGIPKPFPMSRRLLATAAVFTDATGDLKAGSKRAVELWNWVPDAFRRPGSPTVLSVLLELQAMNVLTEVEQHADGFRVRLAAAREAT